MRPLSAALFCLLPLAAAADAPEGRSIPYQKLYAPLAAVKQADPQGVVSSSLCAESVQPDQPLPANLKVELRAGATRQALALDPHGCIALPLRADWASGDAAVWVSQPREAVKLVEAFKMRTPTATRISYGQLMESLPVIERIQQQHVEIGGLMGTPSQGVELAYGQGGTQSVTVGSGAQAKSWSSDGDGHVKIPFDPALPATTPVVLGALPTALRPYSN
ncbi:MAG TPA: hypothetical protein VGH80_12545 [Xanthomonadaceae bacterium]|jgi:hypothetical protein